ncbi:MAG: bifunctional DNA-formamidopyrimidine glycosylase/DNA-(apurinic or apyrimidinic site) lyase [Pseudomonadales bacterium]|nr:bifunctional DNA-formamidopyrimidine glycosylase/DNA-(apurinic or apyrimidinic site) lyase [Pseudomonadales bacterium]
MPELPEVETTKRGIAPYVVGKVIRGVEVRERRLRWPVPRNFSKQLAGAKVLQLERRAKYLLFETQNGFFMLHLGMSGSLRICAPEEALRKHDHLVFSLSGNKQLRFNDPRRFGSALWLGSATYEHTLLRSLGPEPLDNEITAEHLFAMSRKRKVAVKNFIMDNHVVVGVGNIYANEALYLSGIRPRRAAGRVSRGEYVVLLDNIRKVLDASIKMGGSTLRDFVGGDGKPGYFQQTLRVYGREAEPCPTCGNPIKQITVGQRSSFYCANCQR